LNTDYGTLRFRIDELALKRGIVNTQAPHTGTANLTKISRELLIDYPTLRELARNPERVVGIHLSTIARLCWYFKCSPGELIEYVPPPDRRWAPESEVPYIADIPQDEEARVEW
jgi:DNA-binding Xre family transcriptional regulator